TERTVFMPLELTTKARLLSRPEPEFTEAALNARVSGTIVLRAVFAADGTVQNILVLRSLPYGLTERAVKAARKIKFVPATKDGRSVSQFIQIEYNFHLN
ncbi:MAG TPA: energy transducer TonB, partial [Pyrinomonadaceae bacterium]